MEWDAVILSVVDSDHCYFCDSANCSAHGLEVLNTAISRAKRRLILVCDVDYWREQEGQLLQQFVLLAERQGSDIPA